MPPSLAMWYVSALLFSTCTNLCEQYICSPPWLQMCVYVCLFFPGERPCAVLLHVHSLWCFVSCGLHLLSVVVFAS